MKRIVLLVLAFGWLTDGIAQKEDADLLGRVRKINGVEAYIMCEPLRAYETVVDVNTGAKAESLLTGGLVNKSIAGRAEQFIKRIKKENENIDAVVYSSGKRIIGIKFTDAGSEKTKGIGKVSKISGLPTFVMCEPIRGYETLKSEGGGVKWKSLVTAGIANNSIEEDVQKIVKKLDGVKGVEACYFDGTKEGEAIRFK